MLRFGGPPCAKKERPRQTSEAAAKIPFHGSFRMACVRRLAESGPQSPRIIAMALAKIIIATGTATKITMAQRSKTKRDTATAISPIIRPAKNERQDMQKDAAPHLDAHAQLACVQVNFVVAVAAVITQASLFPNLRVLSHPRTRLFGLFQKPFPRRDWCYSTRFRGKLSRGQRSKKHEKIPVAFVILHEICHISIKITSRAPFASSAFRCRNPASGAGLRLL